MGKAYKSDFILQGQYDPHRLIFHMSLGGVAICLVGIAFTLIAIFPSVGLGIINIHVDTLGDYLYSPLAYIYNVSLLLAGMCFIFAMLGLYSLRFNLFTKLLAFIGFVTGLSIVLLGIYPSNDAIPHYLSVVFFVCATLLMFGLIIYGRFKHPELCSNALSICAFAGVGVCLGYFMFLRPEHALNHFCFGNKFCLHAFISGLHTILTLIGGVGVALIARNLLDNHLSSERDI